MSSKSMLLTVVCWIVAVSAFAQRPVIESFHGNGEVTWTNTANTNARYRVEWCSSLTEQLWKPLLGVGGPKCLDIEAWTNTSFTTSVPMFYRVVMLTNAPPSGMVLVPGGTNSGTDPDFGDYTQTVESIWIDRYEVSKEQWDEVYNWATNNGYSFDYTGSGKAVNHPVQTVDWYDCVKWCNARSQKEMLTPAYYTSSAKTNVYRVGWNNVQDNSVNWNSGYRLPTVEEWEYAARGGVTGKRFPWGTDTISHSQANYYSESSFSYDISLTRGDHPDYNHGVPPYTSPVGDFAPNGYGLYDMAGNMWEWCWDWYLGGVGSLRVYHGGGWGSGAHYCRVADRFGHSPGLTSIHIGFRTCLPSGQ